MTDNPNDHTPSRQAASYDLLAHAVARGEDPHAAVARLKIAPETAMEWLNSPDFHAAVERHLPSQDEIRQKFMAQAGKASAAIAHLASAAEDEGVRYRAAKDLLDRAGFTPVRRVATVSYSIPQDKAAHTQDTLNELLGEE